MAYVSSVSFKSQGHDHCYHMSLPTLDEAKAWCVRDFQRRTRNPVAGLNFIAGFENKDTLVATGHNLSYCIEEIDEPRPVSSV